MAEMKYHHGCAFSSGIIFCDVSKRFVSISPAFQIFWPWFVIGCWIAFRSRISSCALASSGFYGLAASATSTAIFASIATAVVLTCVFLRKKEENQFPFLLFSLACTKDNKLKFRCTQFPIKCTLWCTIRRSCIRYTIELLLYVIDVESNVSLHLM